MKIDSLLPKPAALVPSTNLAPDQLPQQTESIKIKSHDALAAELAAIDDSQLIGHHFQDVAKGQGLECTGEGDLPPPQENFSGDDLDTSILLYGSKEVEQSNRLMGGLLNQMGALNQQRRDLATQIAGLDPKAPDFSAKLANLQNQTTSIGTDISMLATFLQEAAASKRQAEELTSNLLAASERTAQNIIQNMSR